MNRFLAAMACFSMVACGVGVEPDQDSEQGGTAVSVADLKAPSGASKTAAGSSRGTTASYKLDSTNAESGSPTWLTSYVINNTSNLYFATDMSGVTGHHVANFNVYLPGGSSYQVISVAFAAGVTPAAGEVAATKTSSGYRVWAAMPVAGTEIQQYNLTGPWTASVMMDSGSSAAASTSFSMN